MRKINYILLSTLLLLYACGDPEEAPLEIGHMDQGSAVANHRINILNEAIRITGSSASKSEAPPNYISEAESSPSFDCSEEITEAFSGNKKVDNKKTVCLAEGVSFNGTVELKGGTFVIKGNATLSGINGNKGKIVITETGSLTMTGLSINNNFEIENYSNSLNVGAVTVSGEFTNHGKISVSSTKVNGGGDFKNTGEMTVLNNFMANNDVENEGKMTIDGDLTINGGAEFDNDCQLIVKGDLQINKTLNNKSYVRVDGALTLNGGAKIEFESQAYLIANSLSLSGSFEGPKRDYARVDISTITVINWGAKVTKKIDINDPDGIETNNGSIDSSVTFDQSVSISETDCNPGSVVPLASPEYTLVADIAVPSLGGNSLSATDVFFDDGFAFISYHLNGAEYSGAIDILNLATINAPRFSMNYTNTTREFNAVTMRNDKVYLAGQRSIDESGFTDNSTRGATLFIADFLGTNVLDATSSWQEIPMPSFSGNAIHLLDDDKLLFASGASSGGFFEVNTSNSKIVKSEVKDHAKYVNGSDEFQLKLVGGIGNAKLLISKDGSQKEVDLGASTMPQDGKNVVAFYDDFAYVTLGSNGLVVVNLKTFEVVDKYKPETPGLTNGVAVDKDFIYLANGESGLLLLRRGTLEYYGQYKYNGSANSVEVFDNVILIANGVGGVKLLLRTE